MFFDIGRWRHRFDADFWVGHVRGMAGVVPQVGAGLPLRLFRGLGPVSLFGALADPAFGGNSVIVRTGLFTG